MTTQSNTESERENQMKICFISQQQFNVIWKRAFPAERIVPNITTASMFCADLNTLFIIGRAEDFLVTPEQAIRKDWLLEAKVNAASGIGISA